MGQKPVWFFPVIFSHFRVWVTVWVKAKERQIFPEKEMQKHPANMQIAENEI
ncbi:hypothetical protein AALD01_15000 [Oscillospiraceae bacterium 21-37]